MGDLPSHHARSSGIDDEETKSRIGCARMMLAGIREASDEWRRQVRQRLYVSADDIMRMSSPAALTVLGDVLSVPRRSEETADTGLLGLPHALCPTLMGAGKMQNGLDLLPLLVRHHVEESRFGLEREG